MFYYIKKNLKFETSPFDWKFLQIGILRAKDLRKNVPILQEGGFTPAPSTLLVIRVVLLHTFYGVLNPLIPQLYVYHLTLFLDKITFLCTRVIPKWLFKEPH